MAVFFEEKDRKIIPRWRDSHTTIDLGELNSVHSPRRASVDKGDISKKVHDWKKHGTPTFAADLIGSAYVLGLGKEVIDAAEFIISQTSGVTEASRIVAEKLLKVKSNKVLEQDKTQVSQPEKIHLFRKSLREDPRNALLWADIALQYTTIGLLDKASMAIEVALNLAPYDRYILRVASRLYIHKEDPERAHELLTRAKSTRHDPWLIAAEVATSQIVERNPHFVKIGRKMLQDKSISPFHLTELASALGTLEMTEGANRKAKKLLRASLTEPTENSIAQASWASRRIAGFDLPEINPKVPRTFEARTLDAYFKADWMNALKSCWDWLHDQPFSSRPGILGSYISEMMLEDYEKALDIIEPAVIANPKDPILINNRVFALANLDRIQEAERELEKIDHKELEESEAIPLIATKGLLMYRRGLPDEGRRLYLEAIDKASQEQFKRQKTIAAIFFAREEMRSKSSYATKAKQMALEEAKTLHSPDIEVMLKQLDKK